MKIVDPRFVGFLIILCGGEIIFGISHAYVTSILTVVYLIHRAYESNRSQRLELAKIIHSTELQPDLSGTYYTFEILLWRDPPPQYKFATSFFILVKTQDKDRKQWPMAFQKGFIFVDDPASIRRILLRACSKMHNSEGILSTGEEE